MKHLYFLVAILLPLITYSQANYQQGYVLKNNGDTLKGYINYRSWTQTPSVIEFKTGKAADKIIKFTTADIQEFAINERERFVTYTGAISMDKIEFPNVPERLDTTKKKLTIFLRQIYAGKNISVFTYTDIIKQRFFIRLADAQPVELEYHVFSNGANSYLEYVNIYKDQLQLLANKYQPQGNIKILIELSRYAEKDILKIIKKIENDNSDGTRNGVKKIFIGVAANRTSVTLSAPYYKSTQVLYSPRLNLGIELSDNFAVRRFVFRGEMSLSYIKPIFKIPFLSAVYTFNQYTLSLSPQVLWNIYNNNKYRFYLASGILINLSKYTNNNLAVNNPEYPEISNNPNFYKLETFWLTVPVSLGFTLNKKIEFSVKYELPSDYTHQKGTYARNQTTSIGINYYLRK